MSRTRLEWACWMASKGITAFIVDADSKRPLGGSSWYVRNTTDPQQLAEWFDMTPDCNYGLWLGEEYVVIDLDVKHDTEGATGIDHFEAVCAENGVENFRFEFNTLMVETPSGGYHLYFKTPFKCANKNLFPNGIDVRGAVGYVVGPGSQVKAGEWAVVDPDMPIMDIPEFLLDYLVTPSRKDPNHEVPLIELDLEKNIEQAMEWLKTATPAIANGTGDQHTYDICCMLRDFGISETEALNVLNESGWNERCEPAWDSGELEVKIRNSYSFGQNRPGCKAETRRVDRLKAGRPAGGWGAQITDEQVALMFHPKATLALVVDNTAEENPEVPTDVSDEDDPLAEFREDEQLWYGIRDFAAIDKVREYLVKGWLIAHGVTALLAVRGTGKSTIALDLGCHIAKDMDWWGLPIMKNWKVIYICGEDDEGMILNVRAWGQYNDRGLPPNDRFLIAKDIIKMTNQTVLRVRLKEMQEWAAGARCLIILDTWARATSGHSSNTQEEMDLAYENAEMVAAALNGPMIACFHPPKDGRMTIRGSAVQEDASSGIWVITETAAGIKIVVERAKGKGRGNYRLFTFEKVSLGGVDSYNDPLEGIVPAKKGGTEDEAKPDYIESRMNKKRAWAKAVIGCLKDYPLRNPDAKKNENNITAISLFLTRMWVGRHDELDAIEFVEEWMDDIKKYDLMSTVVEPDKNTPVRAHLDDEFMKSADTQPVVIGEYTLSVEEKPNTKLHFVIENTKTGIEK